MGPPPPPPPRHFFLVHPTSGHAPPAPEIAVQFFGYTVPFTGRSRCGAAEPSGGFDSSNIAAGQHLNKQKKLTGRVLRLNAAIFAVQRASEGEHAAAKAAARTCEPDFLADRNRNAARPEAACRTLTDEPGANRTLSAPGSQARVTTLYRTRKAARARAPATAAPDAGTPRPLMRLPQRRTQRRRRAEQENQKGADTTAWTGPNRSEKKVWRMQTEQGPELQ